ncbi:MAG: TIGR02281 family clan AA aspartic protease [Paracoccus sp. (in: a-proteobacteria)]|uniref:retropepsin-like aspartic protease family protein n=1 Tax=Paracoccus sp. TaxID=267 RepID=UPI0026E03FD7|nr:TIGR02281 family clan AA aspartic protease [Paracoccus sp. (in: a-proteobacteria)]MDO5611717.1 TIGR02281 family clan AA aspartic protease [Paracoccus sp. (in: a-proteobacteria)]
MSDLLAQDWARLVYLGLLLVFIGGALVFEGAGRRRQALRQAATWAMLFALVAAGASWWQDRQYSPQVSGDGARIELPMGRDGHFHIQAEVNGTPIHFMIDTGASQLVLSPRDARRAGFDTGTLAYTQRAMTANGPVDSAPVRIERLTIGPITDRSVAAQVNGADMGVSLMGMSYLSGFARVSIEGGRMILER